MTKHKNKKQKELDNRHRRMRGFIINGKRQWAILIVVVVALTAVVLLGSIKTSGSAAPGKNLSTFLVRRDDLTITVTESGSIRARTSIDINSKVEGQATIISLVPEGIFITEEDVKNGKVLVELDSSNLEEQMATRQIDLASAKSALAERNESYLIQVKQNESDITAGELAVRFALLDFQKYLGETVAQEVIEAVDRDPNSNIDMASILNDYDPNDPNGLGGSASQQLNTLQDAILLARGNLERASAVLYGTQKLYDANYASELELTGANLDVARFKIQEKSALENLRLYRLYDFPKDAEKFLSDYYEAKRKLERTHAQARARLAQADAKLKGAEASFRLQKKRLEKLQEQIDACIIKAPAPGLVVYGSSGDWRGRRVIEEGGTVHQRQKIISLPNLAQMIAEIDVHESSVDKVRPGQSAKITIDAFPDQTFRGEVLKVAPLPDPQRGFLSPDLKVYKTQVSIEGTHDFLKPGMSAKVEILVEQLEDVVIVPVQVVTRRDGKKVCYCLTPQGPKPREVQTGAFNNTFVQIIDGLEADEEVLLNPPRVSVASKLYARQRPEQGKEPSRDRTPPQDAKPSASRERPQDRQPPQGMKPSEG